MVKKLILIKERFKELQNKVNQGEGVQDPSVYKEFSKLKKIYERIEEYELLEKEISENQEIIKSSDDSDLVQLAKEEVKLQSDQKIQLENDMKMHFIPKDPNDEKNVILEIRAGTGGDEASLFVQALFELYSSYATKKNWRMELIDISEGNAGGYKEVIASISGKKVYSSLKYESGVHRVQRIPKTETQGRIHTSTVTVVVLPEVKDVEIKIAPEDLRIDVCRSSGAGGQHVNTTDSAVRIVHLPTKIMVYCQQEKSQHANKERALKTLYARISDFEKSKVQKAESEKRKSQMGGGDRSQRIRTYNYPQSRVTDHRIQLTTKNLSSILAGDIDFFVEDLDSYYQNLALEDMDLTNDKE